MSGKSSSSTAIIMKLFPLLSFLFFTLGTVLSSPQRYESIFNFGDSLSDTGNFLLSGAVAFPVIGKLPYGVTFFQHATGRCSDGRLVVDFIAEAYGLPYLPPYLAIDNGHDFKHGVNFAVAGATALDPQFFKELKLESLLWTKDSLSIQLGWFKKLKSSLCTTKQDCDNYFKKSLFLVGEIGGNDYNYAFFVGGSIKKLRAFVPVVVDAITKATSALIEEGVVELVVPGNLPIGCSAAYMTLFQSPNKADYDPKNGCLKAFNSFAKYHNNQLKRALEMLRQKYPHARIIYADYYGAAIRFFHAPRHYGFFNSTLTACCGGGGPYNFNNSARCGHIGSKACNNPSAHVNWDGIHLTEASYRHIAKGLISGLFSTPPLSSPL
ncbi:GDSL esterase/lipase At5g45910-like [Quercus robur]|uniref:GDSL esterase/lipase At5g45910-like n=1 Tax=Quercus robur TaxID=38942 RepID=UPI00216349F6|nr:GDSL esterase/lipase At5g45910-like [Quercus robur]